MGGAGEAGGAGGYDVSTLLKLYQMKTASGGVPLGRAGVPQPRLAC